jgi:integrase
VASIENRSRFIVTVKNNEAKTKHFPYNKLPAVEAYMQELRADGYKPKADQLDESWLVRIRQTGYPKLEKTFSSEEIAEAFVKKVEAERAQKIFIDYGKSFNATFAELLVRYLRDEAPEHKSKDLLAYKIEGWLEDSGEKGQKLLQQYRDELRAQGKPVRAAKFIMREQSNQLAWLHKPLNEVTTSDIEHYTRERLDEVAPATVDREIDILRSIFNVAVTVWDYNLVKNPMSAVRRPKYFNERDRRLVDGEEARLLAALATLDLARATEPVLKDMANEALEGGHFTSASDRKRQLAAVRAQLLAAAEARADVIPYLQAFLLFQLMTGARRSETLGLTWEHIDFVRGTAYIPLSKNGRPRKLSLRSEVLELLQALPHDTDRVFAIGVDYLVGAWNKACEMTGSEDLHIHDLRHEAISRVAETGNFTIPDLQQFSGHQDVRMLMRYAHLCASRLAKKLDESFKDDKSVRIHKGRKVLTEKALVKVSEVVACEPNALASNVIEFRPRRTA